MNATGKVWHALYTRPRWEKKVLKYLQEEGIEAFLPLRKTLKQWSDRKKLVEEPLFRSYIFVHVHPAEYYKALNTAGAVRYVVFEGKAAVIPDRQIQMVKDLLAIRVELEVIDETLVPGERVVICYGPLRDIEGEMLEFRSKSVIALRIDHISGTLLVSLPANYVRRK